MLNLRPPRPFRGSYISKEGVFNVPSGWNARCRCHFLEQKRPKSGFGASRSFGLVTGLSPSPGADLLSAAMPLTSVG